MRVPATVPTESALCLVLRLQAALPFLVVMHVDHHELGFVVLAVLRHDRDMFPFMHFPERTGFPFFLALGDVQHLLEFGRSGDAKRLQRLFRLAGLALLVVYPDRDAAAVFVLVLGRWPRRCRERRGGDGVSSCRWPARPPRRGRSRPTTGRPPGRIATNAWRTPSPTAMESNQWEVARWSTL